MRTGPHPVTWEHPSSPSDSLSSDLSALFLLNSTCSPLLPDPIQNNRKTGTPAEAWNAQICPSQALWSILAEISKTCCVIPSDWTGRACAWGFSCPFNDTFDVLLISVFRSCPHHITAPDPRGLTACACHPSTCPCAAVSQLQGLPL